jgi:hypothetical protein
MRAPRNRRVFPFVRAFLVVPVIAAFVAVPSVAQAAQSCGTSSGHTLCVTVSATTLTGHVMVTITNNPNNGEVFVNWAPGGPSVFLMERDAASPDGL